ncbi:unnamed protein product, partial [Polarella glacialis]
AAVISVRCTGGACPGRFPLCARCGGGSLRCPRCDTPILEDTDKRTLSDLPCDLQTISGACSEPGAPIAGERELCSAGSDGDAGGGDAARSGHLQPRAYQEAAVAQVLSQNTIVNLETGLGKTLVAVKCADHFLRVQRGSKVLFCVTTVQLAKQQANFIRSQSSVARVRVVDVTGGTVQWNQSWWERLLVHFDIIVGIGEVFKKAMVDYAFLRLEQLSLLVFDECHHAIGNHPFVAIMQDPLAWQQASRSQQTPRILGLTASYLHGRCADLITRRERLERTLRSSIWCAKHDDVAEYLTAQCFKSVPHGEGSQEFVVLRQRCGDELRNLLHPLWSDPGSVLHGCQQALEKHLEKAARIFNQSGLIGWQSFVGTVLKAVLERLGLQPASSEVSAAVAAIVAVQEKWSGLRAEASEAQPGKLTVLLRLLQDFDDTGSSYRCIVFVEQVVDTDPLARVINHHFGKTLALPISGVESMTARLQQHHLAAFKDGNARFLVATQAMEEGIDVPSCNYVVRYDIFHNVKSHVQGAGRARMKDAQIFYFENDWEDEARAASLMQEAARAALWVSEESSFTYPCNFNHPSTEAQLDGYNCLQILNEYVQKTVHGRWCLFVQGKADEEGTGAIQCCRVPVPTSGGALEIQEEELRYMAHRFAFVAVQKLIQTGHINDRNMPSNEAIAGCLESCEAYLVEEKPSDPAKAQSLKVFAPPLLCSGEGVSTSNNHHSSISNNNSSSNSNGTSNSDNSSQQQQQQQQPRSNSNNDNSISNNNNNNNINTTNNNDSNSNNNNPFTVLPDMAAASFDAAALEFPAPPRARLMPQGEQQQEEQPAAAPKNWRGELNEFLQGYLERPVTREDLTLQTKEPVSHQFVATLTLGHLDGKAGSGEQFSGEPAMKIRDAEQTASRSALLRLRSLAAESAAESAAPEDLPLQLQTACAENSAEMEDVLQDLNPKGRLQEHLMKRLHRPLEEAEFRYEAVDTDDAQFYVVLHLELEAILGTGKTYQSQSRGPKTKRGQKEAEQEVARMALADLLQADKATREILGQQTCDSCHASQLDEDEDQSVKTCPDSTLQPTATALVCLVRPDGAMKKVLFLQTTTIREVLEKYRPQSMEGLVEAAMGELVLPAELTLASLVASDPDSEGLTITIRRSDDW